MQQQIIVNPSWWPAIWSYLGAVLFSYGSTSFIKLICTQRPSNLKLRTIAFITGSALASYLWYEFYGLDMRMIVYAIFAGCTAPVTWKIWKDFVGRNKPDLVPPDKDDTDW